MSTAGILRPDEVVFYHPLDDSTEHTQSQAWTGSGGFVSGKIGTPPTAVSAITGDTLGYGSVNSFDSARHQEREMIAMDSTTVVQVYKDNTTANAYARVGTVSGTEITWGPAHATGDQIDSNGFEIGLARLEATRFLVAYRSGNTGKCRVGTVSGTDITFGSNQGFSTPSIPRGVKLEALDSTTAMLMYSDYNGAAEDGMVRIATVSGTDVTYGPENNFDSGLNYDNPNLAALDSSRCVLCWSSDKVYMAVATASGTDVTVGPAAEVAPATSNWPLPVVALSSTKVVLTFTTGELWVRAGDISGTDITFGTATSISTSAGTGDCSRLSSTQFAMFYRDILSLNRPQLNIGTVSGLSLTFGGTSTPYPTPAGTDDTNTYASCTLLGTTTVVSAATRGATYTQPYEAQSAVGAPGAEAALTASTPAAYPAATGDDRVVVAMWAKDVTKGSSTVVVQRDYKVELAGTTITLGPASAVWSGVAALGAGQANDGADHLLVLDFEHTGAGAWNLRTSLDGAAWVNEGAGTGTRTTSPASADPNVAIEDGESGQWVDELVLWSGDKSTFTLFTSEELANLNDLADTFGEAMDKYEENYGAPICWQATATMPDGTVWRDSGSGPCPAAIRVPRGASDVVVTDDGRVASPRIREG